MINVNTEAVKSFGLIPDVKETIETLKTLKKGTCQGNDFLGWLDLPNYINSEEYKRVKELGEKINKDAEVLVVLGIGGSYLGAKASLDYLLSCRYNEVHAKRPKIYFLGNGMDAQEIYQVLRLIGNKSLYLNVISKSGTTLETAVAFRIFRTYMEDVYGKEEAEKRIIATTDASHGALKTMANENGYETLVIPDNVGGRYSVLSAVGLLPLIAAGIYTDAILEGAMEASTYCLEESEHNPAINYAAARHACYLGGKNIEFLSLSNENMRFFGEWWKQLFAESEGKDGKGVFPCNCIYTADLHSIGQYIQDGERKIFESNLSFENTDAKIYINETEDDYDKLNYLKGKEIQDLFNAARDGVRKAHIDGGVPFIDIRAEKQDAKNLGELIFFFEVACALSSLLNGVNPFNQPGVESYKANMFKLLGRKE